jgi:RNA polymerase sigma-70 factor (ECF subfamily)
MTFNSTISPPREALTPFDAPVAGAALTGDHFDATSAPSPTIAAPTAPEGDFNAVTNDELPTPETEADGELLLADDEDEDTGEEAPPEKAPPSPEKLAFLAVLQRAKEGDLKAFEEIYQMYHRRIYNAVYGMLGDPDDAQDVTQDVFMRLYDALPTLRADEAFSTYLYRIALNLCRDRARRKKRVRFQSMDTPRADDEGDVEPMEFPDGGKLPEEILTGDELQRRVREAVLTLSNDHKAVIVMHHFQGMEVNDIARILGVPTGTVKSRLARGRDQLHRKLRSYLNL